jgi:predicted MFS family arabinose efflux permease
MKLIRKYEDKQIYHNLRIARKLSIVSLVVGLIGLIGAGFAGHLLPRGGMMRVMPFLLSFMLLYLFVLLLLVL